MGDASEANKRKRKSANRDMIFEVDEADCSPTNSDDESFKKFKLEEESTDKVDSNLNVNAQSVVEKCYISFDQESQTEEYTSELEKTIQELREENENLKQIVQSLQQNSQNTMSNDDESPCISIKFKDISLLEMHGDLFQDHIKKMFHNKCKFEQVGTCELGIYIPVSSNCLNNEDICEETLNKKKLRHQKSPTPLVEDTTLFIEDTTPNNEQKTLSLVRYSNTKFDVIQEGQEDDESKGPLRALSECWNCGGTHSLKDCEVPKNPSKINIARKKFLNAKQQTTSSRYHMEEDQKFCHFVPGKISEKLRKALDLRKNELPPYIYKMRELGYPPGWLEEIFVPNSDLSIFIDGKMDPCCKQVKVEPEKVVEYPGFNVPLEKGIKDDYKRYHCPPYSNRHSKNAMLDYLYKMHRIPKEGEGDNLEPCDMELATEDATKPINETEKEVQNNRKNTESPSLMDLEMKKKQLLAELDNGSTSNSPISELVKEIPSPLLDPSKEPDSNSVNAPEQIKSEPTENVKSAENEETNVTEEIGTENSKNASTPAVEESPRRVVLSSAYGTPIFKSASPYSHLPNAQNFAKDVSGVINFENLPDSTGKYDQMIGVLEKVRNTMKTLNSSKKS